MALLDERSNVVPSIRAKLWSEALPIVFVYFRHRGARLSFLTVNANDQSEVLRLPLRRCLALRPGPLVDPRRDEAW